MRSISALISSISWLRKPIALPPSTAATAPPPTGSGSASLTVTGLTATVNVAPATGTTSSEATLGVKVTVTGTGATTTGMVTLSGGGNNSSVQSPSEGIATIVIPANSLSAGSDTLSANYSGDAHAGSISNSGYDLTLSAYTTGAVLQLHTLYYELTPT